MRVAMATLVPIEYHGELVAAVSSERVHILSPRLLALPPRSPELRHVTYVCLLCSIQLAAGRPIDVAAADAWADDAVTEPVNADSIRPAGGQPRDPPEHAQPVGRRAADDRVLAHRARVDDGNNRRASRNEAHRAHA